MKKEFPFSNGQVSVIIKTYIGDNDENYYLSYVYLSFEKLESDYSDLAFHNLMTSIENLLE